MMNQRPFFANTYASAQTRGRIAKILLIVLVVFNVFSIFVEGASLMFPDPGEHLEGNPAAVAIGLLSIGLALLTFVIYIATVVVFCMWLYRSARNLSAFGTPPSMMNHSPGWAVGSFFVPFANLVVPYRAIKEIWEHSRPAESFTQSISPPGWFPLWWAFWILSNIAANVYIRMTFNGGVPREVSTPVGIAADVLSIGAAILAIVLIGGLDRRQEEASRSMSLSNLGATPPPPPNFG